MPNSTPVLDLEAFEAWLKDQPEDAVVGELINPLSQHCPVANYVAETQGMRWHFAQCGCCEYLPAEGDHIAHPIPYWAARFIRHVDGFDWPLHVKEALKALRWAKEDVQQLERRKAEKAQVG